MFKKFKLLDADTDRELGYITVNVKHIVGIIQYFDDTYKILCTHNYQYRIGMTQSEYDNLQNLIT